MPHNVVRHLLLAQLLTGLLCRCRLGPMPAEDSGSMASTVTYSQTIKKTITTQVSNTFEINGVSPGSALTQVKGVGPAESTARSTDAVI